MNLAYTCELVTQLGGTIEGRITLKHERLFAEAGLLGY